MSRDNAICRDCPIPCDGMRRCNGCGKLACEVSGITGLCPECEAEVLEEAD